MGMPPGGTGEGTGRGGPEFAPLRSREQPLRANFLELFFDLAYIFAFAQLSAYLDAHLDWAGAGRTLVLLLPLWWVWTLTSWAADMFDPDRVAIQGLILLAMTGVLVMAVAVPHAYGSTRAVFAGVYTATQIGTTGYLGLVTRHFTLRRPAGRALLWNSATTLPWLAGIFYSGTAGELLWAFGSAAAYAALRLRWPTPGLGRTPLAEFRLAGEHVSERYRQFLVIALGETILTSGLELSHRGFDAARTVAFLNAFAVTVLVARIYIYRAGELLESAIKQSPEPAQPGQAAAFSHLVMAAGVVIIAAGDDVGIAHPLGHARPAWVAVILAGPALFLAGRALLDYTVFARVSWTRVIGLAALAAASPALLAAPPLASALSATAALTGIVAGNAVTWRRKHQPRAREALIPYSNDTKR
ncbi:low temperature requirement protein A [Rugosimonospora acidiphila]|uniref:Low temperature requirement protein A n=1 Tax=Rugosimonospora acidiphila TaxID=556531 RepID=A0ABP9S3N8_9ACTN